VVHFCAFIDFSKATNSRAFLALEMGQGVPKYSQQSISELLFLQNTWVLVDFYQHQENIFVL